MKKLKAWLLWGLFLLFVVLTFVYLWSSNNAQDPNYEVVLVTQDDTLSERLVLTGKIVPRDEVEIKPQVAGIISELYVEPGVEVQAGDVIARISVVPEMMQINNAEAQLSESKVIYERLRTSHERDKALYTQDLLSREELERSEAELKQARIRLEAATEALEIIRRGVSTRSSKESTTLVRSTITGKVLSIPVKVGSSVIQANTFNPGTTIAVVANMGDLIFEGQADETEIGRLTLGQKMNVIIGAIPEAKLSAVVDYISPQGVSTGSITHYPIKGGISNLPKEESNQIRSGYSANAEIILHEAEHVLSIPEACVTYRGDSAFVNLVIEEQPLKTEERLVTLGLSTGAKVEVRSGLKAGDKVRGSTLQK